MSKRAQYPPGFVVLLGCHCISIHPACTSEAFVSNVLQLSAYDSTSNGGEMNLLRRVVIASRSFQFSSKVKGPYFLSLLLHGKATLQKTVQII